MGLLDGGTLIARRQMAFHVNWVIVGSVATAAATILLAVFSLLLWRVNRHLALIQHTAERRNDAILAAEQVRLDSSETGAERSAAIRLWNSGLKATQIRDCFLRYEGADGLEERVELGFEMERRWYAEAGNTAPDPASSMMPAHFVGEWLQSGEMWDVRVTPLDEDRPIRSYRRPEIVVVPVLGHPLKIRVEEPLSKAVREGRQPYDVGSAQ